MALESQRAWIFEREPMNQLLVGAVRRMRFDYEITLELSRLSIRFAISRARARVRTSDLFLRNHRLGR